MSRPVGEGIELNDHLDLVVVKLVARQDAELAVRPKERDGDPKLSASALASEGKR